MNTEKCPACGHPRTAHTDAPDSYPFQVCARMVPDSQTVNDYSPCGCKLLAGIVPVTKVITTPRPEG